MAGILGAAQARHDGVTTTTHKKMDTHFNNWVKFLSACELDDDIFLEEYSRHDRITLLVNETSH